VAIFSKKKNMVAYKKSIYEGIEWLFFWKWEVREDLLRDTQPRMYTPCNEYTGVSTTFRSAAGRRAVPYEVKFRGPPCTSVCVLTPASGMWNITIVLEYRMIQIKRGRWNEPETQSCRLWISRFVQSAFFFYGGHPVVLTAKWNVRGIKVVFLVNYWGI